MALNITQNSIKLISSLIGTMDIFRGPLFGPHPIVRDFIKLNDKDSLT